MTTGYIDLPVEGGGGGGSGTVTSINTGFGLTGGPITTTGVISLNATDAKGFLYDDGAGALSFTGIQVDGVTITGDGTVGNPLIASSGPVSIVASSILSGDGTVGTPLDTLIQYSFGGDQLASRTLTGIGARTTIYGTNIATSFGLEARNAFFGHDIAGSPGDTGAENSSIMGQAIHTAGFTNLIGFGHDYSFTSNNQFIVGGPNAGIIPNWQIRGIDYVMPAAYGSGTSNYVLADTVGDGTLAWLDVNTLVGPPALVQNQIAFGDASNLMTSSSNLTYTIGADTKLVLVSNLSDKSVGSAISSQVSISDSSPNGVTRSNLDLQILITDSNTHGPLYGINNLIQDNTSTAEDTNLTSLNNIINNGGGLIDSATFLANTFSNAASGTVNSLIGLQNSFSLGSGAVTGAVFGHFFSLNNSACVMQDVYANFSSINITASGTITNGYGYFNGNNNATGGKFAFYDNTTDNISVFNDTQIKAGKALKIKAADDSFSVSFTGPTTMAGDTPYTLPDAYPLVDGYVLQGTTAGILSWVAVAAGSTAPTTISANTYTVLTTDSFVRMTDLGVRAVTLPTTPADGYTVSIKDSARNASLNNITVSPGGSDTIEGNLSDLINSNSECKTYIYSVTDTMWEIK